MRLIPLAALFLTIAPHSLVAEVSPQEVGIVVVEENQESQDLGKYYAEKRAIPPDNICRIALSEGETLSRADWEKTVRPAIRKWLGENKRSTQLKCLVTTWGVPLKIGKTSDDRQVRIRKYFLERERVLAARRTIGVIDELGKLGANAAEAPPHNLTDKTDNKTFQDRLQQALRDAQSRLAAINDATRRQALTQQFQQYLLQGGGFTTFMNVLGQAVSKVPAEQQQGIQVQLAQTQGHLTGLAEARNAMENLPASVQRDASILGLLNAIAGRLGQIGWIDAQLEMLAKNETETSFDSELSLILWPEYDLIRWQSNFLHYRFDGSELRTVLRTMMVSRLDGPTVEIARGLVDKALEAETNGLQGTAYLDARGLAKLDGPAPPSGSHEEFDIALLKAEQLLKTQDKIALKVNEVSDLFQAGECPNTVLYCGWYSLANYVDAFEFAPGAVGYHMASSEATTLHDKNSNVWCKKMLEDGITATMGPTFEPYLPAFPRPDDFFPLLMTGKYNLVECYYRTQPFNSWMMTLIGDPLYNPFAKNPAIPAESLPLGLAEKN